MAHVRSHSLAHTQVLYTLLPLAGMGSIVVLWFLGYWIMVWRHSKALKRPASNRSLNPEAPVPKPVSRRQRRTSSRDSASPRDSVSPSSTTAVVKPNKPEASSAGKLLSMAAYKRGLRRSYARGALMSMTVLWIGLHPTLCFQVRCAHARALASTCADSLVRVCCMHNCRRSYSLAASHCSPPTPLPNGTSR